MLTAILTVFISLITCCLTSKNPSSCAEILFQGNTKSGIYTIHPRPWYKSIPFDVYCDMDTDGGGWTVFQRREDYEPHENFTRNWHDYKFGFGDLEKEFWLGNDKLFILTNQDHVELHIDLQDFDQNKRWAQYSQFQVANEKNSYRLSVSGYRGNSGDALIEWHNNANFSTYDKNDVNKCSEKYKGGYWYIKCHASNLNGLYLGGKHESYAVGINWKPWLGHNYSLKKSVMKLRPTNFLLNSICE